jgi:hypothetical protein
MMSGHHQDYSDQLGQEVGECLTVPQLHLKLNNSSSNPMELQEQVGMVRLTSNSSVEEIISNNPSHLE